MYADYEFYKNTYGGTKLEEDIFNGYEVKAEREVNYIVGGKVDDETLEVYSEEIGLATCEVADFLYDVNSLTADKPIASVSSGGESFSYASVYSKAEQSIADDTIKRKSILNLLRPYLGSTGLLYQGR